MRVTLQVWLTLGDNVPSVSQETNNSTVNKQPGGFVKDIVFIAFVYPLVFQKQYHAYQPCKLVPASLTDVFSLGNKKGTISL